MELTRLKRALASRWVTVLAVSLLAAAAAVAISLTFGQNPAPLWEARSSLRFEPEEGQTIADLAASLDEARNIAVIAAEELLLNAPDSVIATDLANSRLDFFAQGSTPQDAEINSRELLQAFLDVDPTFGVPVDQLLAEVSAEADAMQAQIDELSPPALGEGIASQLEFLDAQMGAIRGRLVALVVEEAGATAEQLSGIRAERASLEQRLAILQDERAALSPPSVPELSVEETLLLAALRQRMEFLAADYERLYLRKLGVTSFGTVEATALLDLTPAPPNPVVNGLLGLIGGLLISVVAVMVASRTKGTVWLPEDVTIPILAEVPTRKVSQNAAEGWYDSVEGGPRKSAIQALRSAVEPHLLSAGTAIALTGLSAPSEDVQALAADLGGSMSISGATVLLIDANYASSRALGEYRVGGTGLSDVLGLNPLAPEFLASVDHAVESAYFVRPGLAVLPSGPPPHSPADSLSGRQFRALISAAQSRFDVVFVVIDEMGTPSASVSLQRLKRGIVVMTPGSTTMPAVNSALMDAQRLNIEIVGGVFLTRAERLISATSKALVSERPTTTLPESNKQVASPLARLQTYAIPDPDRSALVPHGPLDGLAEQLGTAGGDAPHVATSLLINLNQDAAGSYASVADFVVDRTASIVTAKYGYGDLSDELIHEISRSGFVTLHPLRERRTAASWLRHEFEREVDSKTATELIEGIERVLAAGMATSGGLDQWLSEQFLRKYLVKTDGEPDVLHLTSPKRNISVLVPAVRLDVELFESLLEEVSSSTSDELERFRAAASARGDIEQAALYATDLDDVRSFESAVSNLLYTETGRKRRRDSRQAWNPDWSLGKRANLAQLQEAGLLPFNVLADEEVSAQLAST